MEEVYVIERLITDGIWELFANIFYTNKKEASNICKDIMETRPMNKEIILRVTTLKK